MMCPAIDRTADFIQSVHCSRASLSANKLSQNHSLPNGFGPLHTFPPEPLPHSPTIHASHHDTSHAVRTTRSHKVAHQHSEFTQMAASIGRDLSSTFGKLEHLTSLARRQTLFDDHSSEIQRLIYVVKEDMADLNHRISTLQSISKSHPVRGKQEATHSHSVLMCLQTRLAKMSNQFRGFLEHRSDSLRAQAARRDKYTALSQSSFAGMSDMGAARPQHTIIPSVLLRDDERARFESSSMENPVPGGLQSVIVADSGTHLAQQQLCLVDQTDSYLASRADTMRSIEHTIVELGEIFQQLATMVHEQDEAIQRIDMNVDDATASIEAGHSELVRYLRSISSNRWLMIKVFAVLLVFFIVFVVFFV